MNKKTHTYMLSLLFTLIVGGIIHTADNKSILPGIPRATQNYEEMVDTLHDIRDAVHRRIDGIWLDDQLSREEKTNGRRRT
ncbi:hypothetical protein PZ84_004667 [Salmonella enterica subsp. enterica]|nr:hypothetical protein [Salmonella enterica subsp. enterica]